MDALVKSTASISGAGAACKSVAILASVAGLSAILLARATLEGQERMITLLAAFVFICFISYNMPHENSKEDGGEKRIAEVAPTLTLYERTEAFKAAIISQLPTWGSSQEVESPSTYSYISTPRNEKLVSCLKSVGAYMPSPWAAVGSMGGHIQSGMFAFWSPPRVWFDTARMVNTKDTIKSSKDGGTFTVTWWYPGDDAPLLTTTTQTPSSASTNDATSSTATATTAAAGGAAATAGAAAGHVASSSQSKLSAHMTSDSPIVLMLPGVVGKAENVYIKRMALHFAKQNGWRTAVKGWRGIGSDLTTPRPETWDDMALSDTLDAIAHIRSKVGPDVPMLACGFSFGGALLTTVVGSVPKSQHTLSGVVSVSGLFDFGSMMNHIATQWGWLYDAMNTKVTVANYRKYKVVDLISNRAGSGAAANAAADAATAAAATAAATAAAGDTAAGTAHSAALRPSETAETLQREALRAVRELSMDSMGALSCAAADAGGVQTAELLTETAADETGNSNGCNGTSDVAAKVVKGLELSDVDIDAISGHREFHRAFTIPFSGDATVEDYIARVERMHADALPGVNVPVLALLAEDDPLCPQSCWVTSLEAAASNENIIVARTKSGGHCGWFSGISGDSWLDEAASQFLKAALQPETDADETKQPQVQAVENSDSPEVNVPLKTVAAT